MSLRLNENYVKGFVNSGELEGIKPSVSMAHAQIHQKNGLGSDRLGWVDLPIDYNKAEFADIKTAAADIIKKCRTEKDGAVTDNGVFIAIGIGGSYLGARAVIEFVKSPLYNNIPGKNTPDVYFAGNTISPAAVADLVKICEGRNVCINVISKSGNTTEPAIAFRIFRDMLIDKYGADAFNHIYITTDKATGALHNFAAANNKDTFIVPDDIGGRYSVLTAVGLLPIAVAGIDIDELMAGAADARIEYAADDIDNNACCRYAAYRNILYRHGKAIEVLAAYEPCMTLMNEWWKQLYGESEGKDKRGIFPASVIFSTDLHSMGQFIQDGCRNLFETVVDIQSPTADVSVPVEEDGSDSDKLDYIAGRSLHDINRTAMQGTLYAHNDGGVPNLVIELSDRSEHSLGHLIYFFEMACALSGYINAINPFDQPGVEAYKNNMYALLGKKGDKYDAIRNSLAERMGK